MQKNDIVFLLSGGQDNANPRRSIGGAPARIRINELPNNLFDDVTREHSFSGYTDYRCFYVMNINEDEKFKNVHLFTAKALEGSEIQLGLSLQNEVQALMFPEKPVNGSFQLVYTIKHGTEAFQHTTREINWVPDAVTMSQRIAAVLNSLDQLEGIQVVGTETNTGFDFLVTFAGASGNRGQEMLTTVNQLGVGINVSRVAKGGPINSIAPNVGIANNPPSGVTFFDASRDSSVLVGTLFPNDFMPVWIKRIVERNTKAVHPDQFKFKMFGDPKPANLRVREDRASSTDIQPLRKDPKMLL